MNFIPTVQVLMQNPCPFNILFNRSVSQGVTVVSEVLYLGLLIEINDFFFFLFQVGCEALILNAILVIAKIKSHILLLLLCLLGSSSLAPYLRRLVDFMFLWYTHAIAPLPGGMLQFSL